MTIFAEGRPIKRILIRETSAAGFDIALEQALKEVGRLGLKFETGAPCFLNVIYSVNEDRYSAIVLYLSAWGDDE